VNGGFLSMPEALRLGANTGIAAGVIMAFVSFLLIQFGPADFLEKLMRDMYTGQKFSAEEEAMLYQGFKSPFLVMMANSFTMAIFGFVCSLLFGFLLRKEKTIFKNKIKE
jgi:ABC-type spermidine/putrescine transport system permease subunit I